MNLKHFQRFLILITLCFITVVSAAPDDPLWSKAVSIFEESENLVPGKVSITMQLKDRKGKLQDTHETLLKLYEDENGDVQSEVIKEVSNGVDVTVQNKQSRENQGSDNSLSMSIGASESVFHPDNQTFLSIHRLEKPEIAGKSSAVAFSFILNPEDRESISGKAWIHSETGQPLKTVYSPSPLPKHVKEIETRDYYNLDISGRLILTKTEVSGMGGFLFIKKYFESSMQFDEHWEYNDKNSENGT